MNCRNTLLTLVLALLAGPAASPPPPAEEFLTELRLAVVAPPVPEGARKPAPPDLRKLEEVLRKRLPILALGDGSVAARSPEEILVRVRAAKLEEWQLQQFTRPGVLQVRYLEDLRTNLNPRGRYDFETLTIDAAQSESTLRFRDRKANRPVSVEAMLQRSPLLLSNADLAPDSAKSVGTGVLSGVRIRFTEKGAAKLARFSRKPGRIIAMSLDGELVGIQAVTRRVQSRRKRRNEEPEKLDEMDLLGGFGSREEAGALAVVLNSGPLPCALRVLSRKLDAG